MTPQTLSHFIALSYVEDQSGEMRLGLASKLIHILDIDPSRLAALPTWT